MRNPAEPDPASQRNTDRCHQSEPECIPAQARESEQKRVQSQLRASRTRAKLSAICQLLATIATEHGESPSNGISFCSTS